jgi:hypothetical protein
MTVLATTTAATRHVVRLVHSATGRPIAAIRVAAVMWPAGWWARVVDGAVVVASTSTSPGPAHIDVVVTDGVLASVLDFPAPDPDQPPHSVRVPLTADEIDVAVDPTELTLTVVVTGATGPSEGLDVKVRGASGSPTVTLTEGEPGEYSATRTWGANLINADLRIGGTTVRKVCLDYERTQTRIYVVDPT